MAGGELSGTLDRSMSRGEGSEGESLRIVAANTALSSFDSILGEQLMSRAGSISASEWATRAEAASSSSSGCTIGSSSSSSSSSAMAAARKKVVVVIDRSRESRLAMLWALSHIVHGVDTLSLMHFIPASHHKAAGGPPFSRSDSGAVLGRLQTTPQEGCGVKAWREKAESRPASELLMTLKTLCSSRRPEVQVEVMTVEGLDKGMTIVSQAKKLEAGVLVLGQKRPSLLQRLFNQRSPSDGVIDYCIQNAECLTLAVRKKSKHLGGYLINSRWQKNFWLLA